MGVLTAMFFSSVGVSSVFVAQPTFFLPSCLLKTGLEPLNLFCKKRRRNKNENFSFLFYTFINGLVKEILINTSLKRVS
jgi:hypothetical protein